MESIASTFSCQTGSGVVNAGSMAGIYSRVSVVTISFLIALIVILPL